jgi:hypothetical protein
LNGDRGTVAPVSSYIGKGKTMDMHTDNLDSIEKLEKAGFEGADACLMISLFEYSLAWKKEEKETLFIYGIKTGKNGDCIRFDRCSLNSDTVPESEWNWADWEEVSSFMGAPVLDLPLPEIVSALLSYYGFENVFGSSYWEGFEIEGDDQHTHA